MYSLNYSNQQVKPVYGFGSPKSNHGIKNVNGNRIQTSSQPQSQLISKKGNKLGVYGRSKDPFKVYRNSQHHVVDTTKFYDRKGQNQKTMGVDDQVEKPSHSMSEMTFRRFKPKKGYLLVEDFKSYQDPIVHPHFIQNARIYESMRSSIGTRQRLDGSLIRNETKAKEEDKEKIETVDDEKIQVSCTDLGKPQEINLKSEKPNAIKKSKRPFSAVQRSKQPHNQVRKTENPQFEEIKKQVVTILNDEDFQIKYDSKIPNFKRPRAAKKKQISSNGLQKIAQDVYDRIKKQEAIKKSTQSSPVENKETNLQEIKQQKVQNKKEEETGFSPKIQEKKIDKYRPAQDTKTLSTIFPINQTDPKLITTQYRRSYSPPKQRIARVESNAKQLELKQKINIEKRQGCRTVYNQMFKYSKKLLDEVKCIIPAGVGTLYAN